MLINIFWNTAVPPSFKRKTAALKLAVTAAAGKACGKKGEVNIIYVDGPGIKKINRAYLGKNRLTDVIAFNYPKTNPRPSDPEPFGDIFVCVPRALTQAKEQGHSATREIAILTAHGALHLAGWDDDTGLKRERMNSAATAIIDKAGF